MRFTPTLVSLKASLGRALTELETAVALAFWVVGLGLEALPVVPTCGFPLATGANWILGLFAGVEGTCFFGCPRA